MKEYIYPKNLSATPTQWFWSLPAVAGVALSAVGSVFAILFLRWWLPLYATIGFAVMTVRIGENTILKRLIQSVRFFFGKQVYGGVR